jgi:hypothetical protein
VSRHKNYFLFGKIFLIKLKLQFYHLDIVLHENSTTFNYFNEIFKYAALKFSILSRSKFLQVVLLKIMRYSRHKESLRDIYARQIDPEKSASC